MFTFGDFNVHHKDWLTFSGGTDKPGDFCYNFSISNELTQIINSPTRIPECDPHGPAFLNLFISCDASICSTRAISPLGNSDHFVISVSIDFPSNSNDYSRDIDSSLIDQKENSLCYTLLFGKESMNGSENAHILHAITEYILSTETFNVPLFE